MSKKYFTASRRLPIQSVLVLTILCGFLCVGCIIGTYAASGVSSASVSYYIEKFANISGSAKSFSHVLLDTVLYHAVAFVMSFVSFGFIFIPVLVGFRGYFFAFSVSVIVRAYGLNGVMLAFLIFGLKAAVAIPLLIYISLHTFSASAKLSGKVLSRSVGYSAPYCTIFWMRCGFVFLILTILSIVSFLLSGKIADYILCFL